jgi:hypothetical protein
MTSPAVPAFLFQTTMPFGAHSVVPASLFDWQAITAASYQANSLLTY